MTDLNQFEQSDDLMRDDFDQMSDDDLKTAPSTNGDNGRTAQGRFAAGNPGGPGNPFARRTAALRAALLEEITTEDVRAVARKLIEMARQGDLAAMKELLSRTIGKPPDAVDPDRLDVAEAVEARLRASVKAIYTEDLSRYRRA